MNRKEQRSIALSHKLHLLIGKLRGVRAKSESLRADYVDKVTSASLLEAQIMFEADRIDEEKLMLQNDLNKRNKAVDAARNLLGEGLKEFQETRTVMSDFDAKEEGFMKTLFASLEKRVGLIHEMHKRIKSVTKQKTYSFGKKRDKMQQHSCVLAMNRKVDNARESMMTVMEGVLQEVEGLKEQESVIRDKRDFDANNPAHLVREDVEDIERIIRCANRPNGDSEVDWHNVKTPSPKAKQNHTCKLDFSSPPPPLSTTQRKSSKTQTKSGGGFHSTSVPVPSASTMASLAAELCAKQGNFDRLYTLSQGLETHISYQITMMLAIMTRLIERRGRSPFFISHPL